jgi:hypothetical protein
MIFKHKKTGTLYAYVMRAWDTNRQCEIIVYTQLNTGLFFCRPLNEWKEKYTYVHDLQSKIVAKEPYDELV